MLSRLGNLRCTAINKWTYRINCDTVPSHKRNLSCIFKIWVKTIKKLPTNISRHLWSMQRLAHPSQKKSHRCITLLFNWYHFWKRKTKKSCFICPFSFQNTAALSMAEMGLPNKRMESLSNNRFIIGDVVDDHSSVINETIPEDLDWGFC